MMSGYSFLFWNKIKKYLVLKFTISVIAHVYNFLNNEHGNKKCVYHFSLLLQELRKVF